jgi:molybdate transport system substrate-binding protein
MLGWPRVAAATAYIAAMVTMSPAPAAEISLLSSTAMREALEDLVPAFERKSGHKVVITFKSGVEVSAALRAGVQADLVVSTREAIDELMKEGRIFPNSRIDFARIRVGMAVRAGAPKPDIRTPEGFQAALLAAKSIGYSKGPSGMHLESVMSRLGIFDQLKARLKQPPLGQRVGAMVARGEVELGV